jgi:drug/metabolite transporter (DMT)-like permease
LLAGRSFPRDRRTHATAIWLGLTNIAAFWGFQNLAISRITAGETAILVYLQPLLVGAGAWLFLGERLNARRSAGLLLGFAGIVVVLGARLGGAADDGRVGYLFAAGAGVAWAAGTIIFKRRGWKASPLWMASLQSLYGAVPLIVLAGLLEHPRGAVTFTAVWTILYASLGAAVLAYWLWYSLLQQKSATQVAAFVFLVPVVAVVGDALFLGNAPGPLALLGGGLVALGIWLVNSRRVEGR